MTQDNDENRSDPSVNDEEFKLLVDRAEAAKFSAAEVASLKRARKQKEPAPDAVRRRRRFSAADIRSISYPQFLVIAALVSLALGAFVAVIMVPDGEHATSENVEPVALAVTVALYDEATGDEIRTDNVSVDQIIRPRVYTSETALAALIVFRNGARILASTGQQIRGKAENEFKDTNDQGILLRLESNQDRYSICVLAVDSRARLNYLLATYVTEKSVNSVASCRQITVGQP